ncbi:hypothetical protein OAI87_00695, partial [Paracoccaceae bacterium]|nr:hypothetical protein [Paracoccaceae bacterium]
KLDSLIEVVKFSNLYEDSKFTLLGTLDGDKSIQTHCTIDLDKYGSVFHFIRVWSGMNNPEDNESNVKQEEINEELSKHEYDFLNDPDHKEMLDDVDEEQRYFFWSYGNEVIDNFIKFNFTTTHDELDKMFEDNWTENYNVLDELH